MTYGAMPSRFIPYDADGTVVGVFSSVSNTPDVVSSYLSGTPLQTLNQVDIPAALPGGISAGVGYTFFWPEARVLLGLYVVTVSDSGNAVAGSNDTANGLDGTWEAASLPSGDCTVGRTNATQWRTNVKPMSFTTSKKVLRLCQARYASDRGFCGMHFYGVKASGEAPDDIVFLDGDAAFAEYTVDKDFGDRPLGTTVVKQFKIKNTSPTKTANTIVVTCNDADFAISTDGTTYGTTFTITSLGAGVSSPVCFIRNTTPAPGAALGPRQVRLAAAVASYT